MPSYLTAGKIQEGMSGTISGEPHEEKHDFQDGKGEKLMFRVPLQLDQPIRDEYANDTVKDWIWNPGVFAKRYLEEKLGKEYQGWINTHGSFHPKPWSSKTRNGFAWHFLPDPVSRSDLQKKAETLVPIPIPIPPIPVDQKSIEQFTANQNTSKQEDKLYECLYCNEQGDRWSTHQESRFLAHVKQFHPEKVPKDESTPPNKRVKKK